jgi:glycosyltransferase involved in cell wall biosynthesis
MPVYNVAAYLEACIISIRFQSFADFELILIDDGSTDTSKEIIALHADLDSRIRPIYLDKNTLGGGGIPRNIGIAAATGTYIVFVDSDDWVAQTSFSKFVDVAEHHQADIVIGTFETFIQDTRNRVEAYDRLAFDKLPTNEIFTCRSHPEVVRISPVPWRNLYRREFIDRNRIAFPEGDYFTEDAPFHWFAVASTGKLVKINEVVSYHRKGREGQTMETNDFKLAAMCGHMNTIARFLRNTLDLPEDQVIVDEFYDYSLRSQWIASRQERKDVKAIISKRLGQVVSRNLAKMPGVVLRENFGGWIKRSLDAYPDYDLTVIIPAFNCESFVEEAINCALNVPGIKTNVIVMDDGSEDRTAEICLELEQRHENLHFFQQKNKGAGRARNAVIPLSTGLYTYFLDADDFFDGEQLAAAVLRAKERDNDLYFMRYKISYHEKNEERDLFHSDKKLWDKFAHAKSNNEVRTIAASLINYPWNRVIKTELLHEADIFFGGTAVNNDVAFHWQSILAANNIGYGQEVVCTHRKFEPQQSQSQITHISDQRRLSAFDALESTFKSVTGHANGKYVIEAWHDFARHVMNLVKEKISSDLMPDYEERKSKLIGLVENQRTLDSVVWASQESIAALPA